MHGDVNARRDHQHPRREPVDHPPERVDLHDDPESAKNRLRDRDAGERRHRHQDEKEPVPDVVEAVPEGLPPEEAAGRAHNPLPVDDEVRDQRHEDEIK